MYHKLERGCARLGIALSAAQATRLCEHLALLSKWNRRLNLTAITRDDMVVRHLLDCLAIAPFVRGPALLDVGSGGGFPGVPLAVVMPQLTVTLLDSRGKRIEFLRNVCARLELDNVRLIKQRVEAYRPTEKFDTLATRAFASLGATLNATAALHHPGSRLLAMKGRMPTAELAQIESMSAAPITATPMSTAPKPVAPTHHRVTIEKLNIPFLAAERHLIIIEF